MITFQTFVESVISLPPEIKNIVAKWPMYVNKDFTLPTYAAIVNKHGVEDAVNWLTNFFPKYHGYQDLSQIKWEYKKIPVKLDLFEPNTKAILEDGMQGGVMAGAKNDLQRHEKQKELLANVPPGQGSPEPVIYAIRPKGYELLEGRHRTIYLLTKNPQGFTQNAYILRSS